MDQKQKSKYLLPLVGLCKQWLHKPEAQPELDYLSSRIDSKYFDLFNFGYFPKDKYSLQSFTDEYGSLIKEDPIKILLELELLYNTDKTNKISAFFKNHRLIIPFYDAYGNPIALVGRTLLNDAQQKELKISKYKNSKFGKRKYLYGLNLSYRNIINKNKAIIVEGQFDCISGYINGFDNICALGSSKFTFENTLMLKRYTDNFYVLLDNDAAGECGFEKIKSLAEKHSINLYRIALPTEYKDLDEYLQKNDYYNLSEEKII